MTLTDDDTTATLEVDLTGGSAEYKLRHLEQIINDLPFVNEAEIEIEEDDDDDD